MIDSAAGGQLLAELPKSNRELVRVYTSLYDSRNLVEIHTCSRNDAGEWVPIRSLTLPRESLPQFLGKLSDPEPRSNVAAPVWGPQQIMIGIAAAAAVFAVAQIATHISRPTTALPDASVASRRLHPRPPAKFYASSRAILSAAAPSSNVSRAISIPAPSAKAPEPVQKTETVQKTAPVQTSTGAQQIALVQTSTAVQQIAPAQPAVSHHSSLPRTPARPAIRLRRPAAHRAYSIKRAVQPRPAARRLLLARSSAAVRRRSSGRPGSLNRRIALARRPISRRRGLTGRRILLAQRSLSKRASAPLFREPQVSAHEAYSHRMAAATARQVAALERKRGAFTLAARWSETARLEMRMAHSGWAALARVPRTRRHYY